MKTLVLGIGNLLLGDEGVGVHAARELLKEDLPADTEVLEVGTAILDTLSQLKTANRVIILDAMKYEGEPGTIYSIPHYLCRSSRHIASMHGFDISRVLALAGLDHPPQVWVLGVEPAFIDWSLELSPQVAEALPLLIEAVKREIKRVDPAIP